MSGVRRSLEDRGRPVRLLPGAAGHDQLPVVFRPVIRRIGLLPPLRRRTEPRGADGGAAGAMPGVPRSMRWITVGDLDLLECEGCDGTWIEADAFERLCASRESQAAVLHGSAARQPVTTAPQPTRYRPCLRCGTMMNRMNFGRRSGTVVDVCRGHGTFLDPRRAARMRFERLCASRESKAAKLHESAARQPITTAPQPSRYRPCLRGGTMMNRMNFGRRSGTVVDVCRGHGTFLDRGELHRRGLRFEFARWPQRCMVPSFSSSLHLNLRSLQVRRRGSLAMAGASRAGAPMPSRSPSWPSWWLSSAT